MKFLPNNIVFFHTIYNKNWFENILLFLKNNFNLVSLSDIEKYYYEKYNLRHSCHITFDDGHKSFYEIAFPLLLKYNIPASIYVSPQIIKNGTNFWFQEIIGYDTKSLNVILKEMFPDSYIANESVPILAKFKELKIDEMWQVISEYQQHTSIKNKSPQNINVKQLIEVYKSGIIEIGAHTKNHPILKNETDEVVEQEIKYSINELADILGVPIRYFAYPNGNPNIDFGEREINILKDCSIKLAFSVQKKSFDMQDSPLSIPRNGISKGNKVFLMTKLLAGNKWDNVKRMIKGKLEIDYRKNV